MKYDDARKEEMWLWFHETFAPAEECNPPMADEYGYQYVCGGPYLAADVLMNTYGSKFPMPIIREVIADLESESYEWVIRQGHPA